MASGERRDYLERAAGAFEPVSEMLDSGRCEPLKAAVHGVLLVTVSVCAAYNAAAWLKHGVSPNFCAQPLRMSTPQLQRHAPQALVAKRRLFVRAATVAEAVT